MRVLTKVPHFVRHRQLLEELPQKLLSYDVILLSENILFVTNTGDKEVIDFLKDNISSRIEKLDYQSICRLCFYNQKKIDLGIKKFNSAAVITLQEEMYRAISPDVLIEIDARMNMQEFFKERLGLLSKQPTEKVVDYYSEHRRALSLGKA